MSFTEALEFTLKHEGEYSLDLSDPGGETHWGISKRAYPQLDITQLSLADAKEIYRSDYWLRAGCDILPLPLSIAVFDYAVHSGVARAVEGLQRTVGAPPDGEFGPVTLAAARAVCASTGPVVVALALIDARRAWLLGLHVAGGRFDKGFKARCDELAELVSR